MKYKEQLKTAQWKRKRKVILTRDNNTCSNCGSKSELNVHHIYYVSGNMAWDYPNNALITLCSECHKVWHKKNKIEVRSKIWCKKRDYKTNKIITVAATSKKQKKKNKIFSLAGKLGLNIKDPIVVEIVKNNKYSKASFLFKELISENKIN